MHNPFSEDVPVYIGVCTIIAMICSILALVVLAKVFHFEWLFLLVPIVAAARAGYYIFRGK